VRRRLAAGGHTLPVHPRVNILTWHFPKENVQHPRPPGHNLEQSTEWWLGED
jgi:hypothetical protein